MVETAGIAARIADELGALGLLTTEQLAWAHAQADTTGEPAGRIVLNREFVSEADVARVLEDSLGVPRVDLASYSPDEEAIALVPEKLARAIGVLPLFEIDGVLTVAIGRASDVFDLDSLAAEIGLEVEAVLAEPDAVERALVQCYGEVAPVAAETPVAALAEPGLPVEETFKADTVVLPEADDLDEILLSVTPKDSASSKVDLDVLAVADARRTALLVVDILEVAVSRGATGIHVFPYMNDFFVAVRVDGRLEQLGQAPISLQGALIDALKGFVHMPVTATHGPAVSRIQTEVGGTPVTLAASAVQTLSGARLVIGIEYSSPAPRAITELGMSDAEARAVAALVERGRGLVLLAAPVGEGLDETYYALLAHAAATGRSVYSVERGSGPTIPAVAQVPVLPGSTPGAAYVAAGLGQDTDVLAVESVHSADELHLAMEAVRAGKLVIAGVTAAGATAAIRRLLDMGVEPVSLSSTLTVVIGQRSMSAKSGQRVVRFEVLPVTDALRSAISEAANAEELAVATRTAGSRPTPSAGAPNTASALNAAADVALGVRAAG